MILNRDLKVLFDLFVTEREYQAYFSESGHDYITEVWACLLWFIYRFKMLFIGQGDYFIIIHLWTQVALVSQVVTRAGWLDICPIVTLYLSSDCVGLFSLNWEAWWFLFFLQTFFFQSYKEGCGGYGLWLGFREKWHLD